MLQNKKSEIRKLLVNQYFPNHLLVRETVGWRQDPTNMRVRGSHGYDYEYNNVLVCVW